MSHTDDDYDPWKIEARLHKRWAEEATYRTPEPESGQETFYCLDFFPYPSGAGLSVGHGRNYVPSDVVARYQRMQGKAVLHPMGWDAFGLPAENEAMKQGVHPAESTTRYAANYRRQLTLLGCSYDWEREINSSHPGYYRWNQAFFLALYRRGLAYRAAAPVNWCESCQTVLAAEEIEAGTCWRCHQPVVRRRRLQWYIRVTAYAEELSTSLAELDWPEHILAMQRHWIGRHEGVEIDLPVAGQGDHGTTGDAITVFTTRADTLFGVTFVVLAPEHPLAEVVTTRSCREAVRSYIEQAGQRSDIERHTREPDGVFTGAYVVLPQGGEVPVYVAAYVLADYGTGAVMGVPAHDTRDHAFAKRYDLAIHPAIAPRAPEISGQAPLPDTSEKAFTDPGIMVASGKFGGMRSEEAQGAITAWLEAEGVARHTVHYRLRDWLVSRQRYWGTPIPIIHCPACGEVPVEEVDLPVRLPPLPDYRPRGDGRSPLANLRDFVETSCPRCGGAAERETDTLTGFVCSSWYYMRFTDPGNTAQPFDREKARQWLPVDLYIGGAEHAVGHLLYSRFWTKALADEGWVDFREPFPVLRSQGVLHARNPETGAAERMSKSRGNVVTPESVIERYGADVTRLHLLFMGPFEANTVWEVEPDGVTPQHIEGVRRFLNRVWALCDPGRPDGAPDEEATPNPDIVRATHQTIKEVTEQFGGMRYNTAISALMRFLGELEQHQKQAGATEGFVEARRVLLTLLAPLAPFITEALWQRLGMAGSIHHAPWPLWDPALIRTDEVEIAVQINGRTRDHITVTVGAEEEQVREQALSAPGIQRALAGAAYRRIIIVPGRIINIVV
jgi:leucyl-tRNA synthetase